MSTIPPIEDAVRRYVQLEEIRDRAADASGMSVDFFATAERTAVENLARICAIPDVLTELETARDTYDADVANLAYLRDEGLIDEDEASGLEEKLEQQKKDPKLRLAAFVLNELSDQDSADAEDEEQRKRVDDFFNRSPKTVAKDLTGMELMANRKKVVITEVRPQDGKFNESFLASRPVFGPDRRDVYIANFRGMPMIFLRAGSAKKADSCVCIMGIEHRGQVFDKPTKAAKALKFEGEQVADLEFDGDVLKIVRVTDRD